MASLYSAQAAINARQQLNHDIEEGILKGEIVVGSHQQKKPETHNPYHYKQTVHEKCKHHNEKEGLLHKKLHEHIDQTKINEEREHQSSSLTHYREMTEQREEVEGGMKKWARIIEACLKGQHKLSDKELNEQHANFYKWLYFIEKLFRFFQNSLKTQTSIHSINQQNQSDKFLSQSHIVSSPKINHKIIEIQHDLKLPPIPTKQRVLSLQKRVKQLQYQLQLAHTGNKILLDSINETSSEWHKYQEMQKKKIDRLKAGSEKINMFLGQLEAFNNDLLSDLNVGQKLKEYPSRIASNLTKIKDFREYLHNKK